MSKSKVSTSTEAYTPTARVTAFLNCLYGELSIWLLSSLPRRISSFMSE
jgi:hypothetical protein